jgi:hypothetical protein
MTSQQSDKTWTPSSSQSFESQQLADQLHDSEFGTDLDDNSGENNEPAESYDEPEEEIVTRSYLSASYYLVSLRQLESLFM